jgi:hypothetical protein
MWFLCKDILDSIKGTDFDVIKGTDFDVSFQNTDSEFKYIETMGQQVWLIMRNSF